MPEFNARRKNSAPVPPGRANPVVHARQCSICRHPQRADIERAFLDWTGPREISREYGLSSHTTVYRHAHALGLFLRRERALRFALGRLIERVGEVRPTAASIVSAIRLMAKLNDKAEPAEDSEPAENHVSPDISSSAAPTKTSPHNGSPSDDHPLVARGFEEKSVEAPVRAKPAQPKDEGGNQERGAEDEGASPPIAFAPNAAPRRKFLWR
jgi:hypothetical protein